MKLGSKQASILASWLETLLSLRARLFESSLPIYEIISRRSKKMVDASSPAASTCHRESQEERSIQLRRFFWAKAKELLLPLGDAAGQLLDLLLVRTTRFGPLRLRSGLLAGGALQFLSFLLVFNLGGICHL
jgi:hypothetical protein